MNPNYKDIKSFEDACKVLNIESALPDFSKAPAALQKHLTSAYQLPIIVNALNGDWTPNWSDDNWKYMPYFWMNDTEAESGFSLRYVVGDVCSLSGVGSRLCFRSRALAEHAVEQFFEVYKAYFLV